MTSPTVGPTKASQVLSAAVLGGGAAWLLVSALEAFGRPLPALSPIAWISEAVLGLATGWLALVRSRAGDAASLQDPRRGRALVLWGRTSVLAGTTLAAGYLVVAVASIPGLYAPNPTERVVHGLAAAAVGVGWAVAGWLLERACRVPPFDEDGDPPRE